jgi:ABC-type lipoprotein export system ATPase subunit
MIELRHVDKNYGAIKVVEGMTLRVEDGESLCIVGRSGCGKSTLLKLIALVTRPDRGSLMVNGRDITSMTDVGIDRVREENMAYSFQEPLLLPYISALENITAITGTPKKRAVSVLTSLGLGDRLNHKPPKLSGGEKKRVDVARAILRGSPVLVVDEPLSNLDAGNGVKVMDMLKEHTERGGVLVYSSVEPTQARFAAQVVNMEAK